MVVDVVLWNAALYQFFGILAGLQATPSPGALNGYSFSYQPGRQGIGINRLNGESPSVLARVAVNRAPGESYRFVPTGEGSRLQGGCFQSGATLVSAVGADTQFNQGHCRIFGYDTSNTGAVNVIFDSYSAGPVTVPRLALASSATTFSVNWARRTGAWHLESSMGLAAWEDMLMDGTVTGEEPGLSEVLSGRRFYRLAEGWRSPVN